MRKISQDKTPNPTHTTKTRNSKPKLSQKGKYKREEKNFVKDSE